MPRMARQSYDTCYFHIIVQGIKKEYIFQKKEYIQTYLKLLKEYQKEYHIKIIAYCIMNNHAHILIEIKSIQEMSQYMKIVNIKYAQYYNKREQRVGYVFRNRYKSQPIYKEEYLLRCINYIHKNPVKANIVLREEEYPYSSYQEYKGRGMEIKEYENTSDMAFLDIDGTEVSEEIIRNFEIRTKKVLEQIKNEKILLDELVIELKCKGNLSNREISRILEKDKNTINRIIKRNAVNGDVSF